MDPLEAQKVSIQKVRDLKNAYARFAQSEDGKAILADLELACFVRQTTFHDNPQRQAFNEGARAIWLWIERRIKPSEPSKGE